MSTSRNLDLSKNLIILVSLKVKVQMGKNKKKWKIRKFYILRFLCPRNFKCEINIPHIVKFNSRSDLFSSIFRFQYEKKLKKIFLWFWEIFVTFFGLKSCKKRRFQHHFWNVRHFFERTSFFPKLIYPSGLLKMSFGFNLFL